MNIDRFKMMIAGGQVTRFHTGLTIKENTVAQHTFNMLVIADNLYMGQPPDWLMRAILYHDLHEAITGDIPYPVKKEPDVRLAIKALEHEVEEKFDLLVPLNPQQQDILKAIDMLEFLLYMSQEAMLGNRNNRVNIDLANAECVKHSTAWDSGLYQDRYRMIHESILEAFYDSEQC